jgi:polyketide biosynthesis malonyl-CoA-[acyl-carrier-protein] transacylase
MAIYVFPGQGSQIRGMGESLFDEFPEFVELADDILGYSIAKLCLENPKELLNQTNYTQPALYVVNTLSYLKKNRENRQKPSYLAGHSLGEYCALFAANVFDFETGLRLVQKRGQLMSQTTDGGMAAVIGLKNTEVEHILEQENLKDVTIANYNTYTQVVISGPRNAIDNAQFLFEKAGASLFLPLKVSGAFHSPFMKAAQQQFIHFLEQFNFNAPNIPVIANVNAKPYQPLEIHSLLIRQITHPVYWTSTIEYLLAQKEVEFIEVGPGSVLTNLIHRIKKGL